MEEETKKQSEVFDEDHFVTKQTVEEKQEARMHQLMSSIQQGWKICIARSQPSWCKGTLETIEIYDPSETIDVDYLIRTWGGQRLHLKIHDESGKWIGGGSISLFSYPPRVHGRLLNILELNQTAEIKPQQTIPNPVPYAPPQQATPQIDLPTLIKLIQGGKQNDLGLALKILEHTQGPQAPQAHMGSMVEQMASMMGLFTQMKDMFGGGGDLGGGGGDPESVIPMITEMVKGLIGQQQQKQLSGGKPVLRPPSNPVVSEHKVSPLRTVGQSTEDNLSTISDKLSNLSATDAADCLVQALGNMPEEKRQKAMEAFFVNMAEPELDDSVEEPDNYCQHDNGKTPTSSNSA